MNSDTIRNIYAYYERIENPREEGDFLESLNFFINHAIFKAAAEYIGWAGLIDAENSETGVDVGKVEENLDVGFLAKPFSGLIPVLCGTYGAPDPYKGDVDGFIGWYRAACERNGTGKIFPDFVFRKFFASVER